MELVIYLCSSRLLSLEISPLLSGSDLLFRDVGLLHLIYGLIMDTLYVTLLQVLAEVLVVLQLV